MEAYGVYSKEGILGILNAVDGHQEKQQEQQEGVQVDSRLARQLQEAQAENQALKAHLLNQLDEMRRENNDLKKSLEISVASCSLVTQLQNEVKELKNQLSKFEAPAHTEVDLQLKHFNAIPKSLKEFYKQMKNGDDHLPPFTNLETYRTNKSTKGAYCKRKAIFNFMESCGEDVDGLIEKYKHLSPLQVYEQCIKKSRQESRRVS
jgi:copper chaperone CopZ